MTGSQRVLSGLGLERSPVGFDKNFIGAGFWEDVARRLPAMAMLDCSDLMDEVRLIKTSAEIELFRAGATLLDAAFAEVLPTIRAGERECEVHGRLIAGCLARGAEFAHGILNSHRNPRHLLRRKRFRFRSRRHRAHRLPGLSAKATPATSPAMP